MTPYIAQARRENAASFPSAGSTIIPPDFVLFTNDGDFQPSSFSHPRFGVSKALPYKAQRLPYVRAILPGLRKGIPSRRRYDRAGARPGGRQA